MKLKRLIPVITSALLAATLTGCALITIYKYPDGTPVATSAVPDSETTPPKEIQTETFAGVGDGTIPESSGAVTEVASADNYALAQKYLAALPSRDFDGVGVNIISTDGGLFAPSSTSSTIDAALAQRNAMVEKKYDTTIIAETRTAAQIYDEVTAAVNSGDYYADLVALPQNWLGSLAASRLLLNLNSLPFTDYTAPYYYYDAMLQTAAGYNIYGAFGDLNVSSDYVWCLYYNRTLIKKLGLDDPAALAYDGKWTWDRFEAETKAVSSLNGVYGHGSSAADEATYIDLLNASAGNTYYITGVGKVPALKAVKSGTEKLISYLRNMLYGDGTVYDGGTLTGKYSSTGARNAFYSGKLLFYADRASVASWFSDMSDDWSIVPEPKLTEDQANYYSYIDISDPIVCVLKNSATVENAGLYLQAANAASYGFIYDVWYDDLTKNVIRSSDALNMLDIVLCRSGTSGKPYLDFALIFGQAYPYIADVSYNALISSVQTGSSFSSAVSAGAADTAAQNASNFTMLQP